MIEAELHQQVQRQDLDRALRRESVYDVAETILARKPELSDPTRE
jgi:hypothetical protein